MGLLVEKVVDKTLEEPVSPGLGPGSPLKPETGKKSEKGKKPEARKEKAKPEPGKEAPEPAE